MAVTGTQGYRSLLKMTHTNSLFMDRSRLLQRRRLVGRIVPWLHPFDLIVTGVIRYDPVAAPSVTRGVALALLKPVIIYAAEHRLAIVQGRLCAGARNEAVDVAQHGGKEAQHRRKGSDDRRMSDAGINDLGHGPIRVLTG